MSDYIKREDAMEVVDLLLDIYKSASEELIEHLVTIAPKEFRISKSDELADLNFEIDGWKNSVKNIPSVDVAPVVRCKDCKHCNTDWAMGVWYGSCRKWNTHSVMADWFCVQGERKEDGKDD